MSMNDNNYDMIYVWQDMVYNIVCIIQGSTALIYASEEGHLEITKYLLAQGANINDKTNGVKKYKIYNLI